MKLFGNNNKSSHAKSGGAHSSRRTGSGFNHDTAELDVAAVRAAYDAAAADKKTEELVNRNKKSRGKKVLIVLAVLLALIMVAVVWYKMWSKPPEIQQGGINTPAVVTTPDPQETPDDTPEPEATPEPTPEPDDNYYENGRKKGTYTFLLIGSDNGFGNTDTILYAVLDTVDHTVNVVNIPRDTQVNVPWSIKRINAVYSNSKNDIGRLREEVGGLFGYAIDESYAIVDLEAFVKIVDCIGGVEYNVPVDMHDYIPDQNFTINVNKGLQLLDGEKALQVVRFRSGYANADIGRINTQQDFLMAAAKQVLSLKNIPNLPELMNIIAEYVETNLTNANIAFFIEEFLKVSPDDIHFHTLPGDGYSIKGGAYYWVRTDEWVDIVNTGFNPFNVEMTPANMDYLVYKNGDVYTSAGEYYGTDSFLDYNAYIAQLTGK